MKTFAIILASAGTAFIVIFALTPTFNDYSWTWNIDSGLADNYGSLIGGLVGSIFSLAGFFLLYETLTTQVKQQYETRLFELVKYHRENVSSFRFCLPNDSKGRVEEGSQVVIEFKKQVESLFPIVAPILKEYGIPEKDIELEMINASYLAFFFGVSLKTRDTLKGFLIKSGYSNELCDKLINIIRAKKTAYNNRIVYYGGHQSKLGNYFRNLYNIVEYIHKAKKLSKDEKYDLLRILRTQLTTYEQTILFYNSLSIIGKPWQEKGYLNDYKLIKNIPLGLTGNISPKKYYSNISFEYGM